MAFAHISLARRWPVAGALALSCLLAACSGGSQVAPKDFVGAGGAVAGAGTTGSGTTGTGTTGTGTTGTGTTGTGTTGTGTTGTGAIGGATTGTGTTGNAGNGGTKANSGVKAGSCAGFKNGPGITDQQITIATAADVSGPVPNQFRSIFNAMNAYVAYFNATSNICGRSLKLLTYDTALSATGSNDASKAACQSSFALVGSYSAFDSGGANVTQACGQPDLRSSSSEPARQHATTSFAVSPLDFQHTFLQPWVWAKSKFGNAIKKSGFVYVNAAGSVALSQAIIKGTTEKLGYNWDKTIVVDFTSIPNWGAYASQLKAAGITFVQTNLASFTPQLKAAMDQANYHPAFMADPTAYNPTYLEGSQGKSMEGAYLSSITGLVEETARNSEMRLYSTWLSRTGGGAADPFGAEGWAAGKLFAHLALQLGGKLTRASLIDAIKQVHNYDGNGIITPADPGSKTSLKCVTILQVKGGKFNRVTPYPWTCGPLS